MKNLTCERVRDLLPEWLAGSLGGEGPAAVREHLSGCAVCRQEEALLRAVLAVRPEPPAGLEARIQARVRAELPAGLEGEERRVLAFRRRGWRSWTPAWALSAAALVALSLGIGVVWNGETPAVTSEPLEVAAQEPLPEAWLWDDGLVAGAPVYEDLTDEELQALIEEMEG